MGDNSLFFRTIIQVIVVLLLSATLGCASYLDPRGTAFSRAEGKGFTVNQLKVGKFELATFHRGLVGAQTLVIYIEGDGRIMKNRKRLSKDPTPREQTGLKLALADPSPSVLYVGRPCQYLSEEQLASCDPNYWVFARYAEEVISATNQVVDWAVAATENPTLEVGLVGYSGGGAVAALVASRRTDIDWLVTVAGNLDHKKWTEMHARSPLVDSLNPIEFASKLTSIPQLHLVGGEDENIPRPVADSFVQAFEDSSKITVEVVADYDHDCCWAETWPETVCTFAPAAKTLCAPP